MPVTPRAQAKAAAVAGSAGPIAWRRDPRPRTPTDDPPRTARACRHSGRRPLAVAPRARRRCPPLRAVCRRAQQHVRAPRAVTRWRGPAASPEAARRARVQRRAGAWVGAGRIRGWPAPIHIIHWAGTRHCSVDRASQRRRRRRRPCRAAALRTFTNLRRQIRRGRQLAVARELGNGLAVVQRPRRRPRCLPVQGGEELKIRLLFFLFISVGGY